MESPDSLNSSHKHHLQTSFKYVDELLSDVESILVSSTSKSPFPKYRGDLSPVQIKGVQDYIARIRAQMIQVLKSQGISPPNDRSALPMRYASTWNSPISPSMIAGLPHSGDMAKFRNRPSPNSTVCWKK